MAEPQLKSYDFRREREATWTELDALVQRANRSGLDALTPDELLRLPVLYRATLSALSVARSITLDQNVLRYLESLGMRAYFCIYGGRASLASGLWRFFAVEYPAAVRNAAWPILLSAAIMVLGAIVGHVLTAANPDWYYSFVSESLANGRGPTSTAEELRAVLYSGADSAVERLNAFASFLFTHNARSGMLCFALGFFFGVPTAILLFTTGLMLGAFTALYAAQDLLPELAAWLTIHGTTELLAVALCGGAGFVVASALIFPTRQSRLARLANRGRQAAKIVIGTVALFFAAALLEGFGRQLITDMTLRYLIGTTMLVYWLLYFLCAGASRDRD